MATNAAPSSTEQVPTDRLLTARQVAAIFQVEVTTIWRRCEEGRMVPPPVLRRPYRFSPVQVQQVIEGTYRDPLAQQPGRRRFFARGARARVAVGA